MHDDDAAAQRASSALNALYCPQVAALTSTLTPCLPIGPPSTASALAAASAAVAFLQENVRRTFKLMQSRGFVREGDLVVVVSDLRPQKEDIIRSVQVRRVQ
jgi:hypothetical protein